MIMAPPVILFLWSVLLGGALGACYDVFRILRIAVRPGKLLLLVQDLLFFLLAAAASFLFFQEATQGVVRVSLLAGELLGFLVYYFTVGAVVYRLAGAIIGAVKKVLSFLFRIFLRPILLLFRFLGRQLRKPLAALWRKIKIIVKKIKKALQSKRVLMYNQSIHKQRKKQADSAGKRKRRYGQKNKKKKKIASSDL